MFLLDCIELFLSMRGCLEMRSFTAGALRVILKKFFIALASTYIARLNDEALPSAQQILNFVQADDAALDFWQEMAQI